MTVSFIWKGDHAGKGIKCKRDKSNTKKYYATCRKQFEGKLQSLQDTVQIFLQVASTGFCVWERLNKGTRQHRETDQEAILLKMPWD